MAAQGKWILTDGIPIKLCGSGEIVVIENNLGVRITDFRDDF